jgi:hypothetical protein
MNAQMPLSLLAKTMKWWALGALVMKVLVPFSTHSLPFFTAVLFIAPASEPASGSVSANDPIHSPRAIIGRYFFFCSSLPKRTMPMQPMPVCTLMNVDSPHGPRPSISCTSAFCSTEKPTPPYCSGMLSPSRPSSLASAIKPSGRVFVFSISRHTALALFST